MPVDAPDLTELAAVVGGRAVNDSSVRIHDVTHDSRSAGDGVLFVAIRGARADGHTFVPAVVAAGSPAVCVEDETVAGAVPALVVADTRAALGPLAARVHGDPSSSLRLVGVTGTNGKTTVTHLIGQICRAADIPEAVLGTIGARVRGEALPLERTTPEASDLQRMLRAMVDAGVDVAAIEVSSHALELGRVAAARFAVGAFTNLSQDHLDFHGDMASYEAAKARLFRQADRAVVWIDDPAGVRIAAGVDIPLLTVGTGVGAGLRVTGEELSFAGSRFTLEGPDGAVDLTTPLIGRFNIANAAVAAACARALDISWEHVAAGLARPVVVPGRFELVATAHPATVVVDYAHTPEGIRSAVATTREILGETGRVIVVVGAGGDRDRAKRPMMGSAASDADIAVLTSDNPRSEDPDAILDSVVAGADGPGTVIRLVDRRAAIARALAEAAPGDAVLILGKGHERTQDLGGSVVPFDDRRVAIEVAAR